MVLGLCHPARSQRR